MKIREEGLRGHETKCRRVKGWEAVVHRRSSDRDEHRGAAIEGPREKGNAGDSRRRGSGRVLRGANGRREERTGGEPSSEGLEDRTRTGLPVM
jgi:hypothetical protein